MAEKLEAGDHPGKPGGNLTNEPLEGKLAD
jgi:hypothetical protein